eukprot:gnl/TRDRNA2_/TRDRNA2_197664_c0_seq1.p1 gnl/TRDRNA2_/TRDRNA2_197664_c0~~gnl/TRDRNA2_/TRDRNA2_197664_c0_seq1.p1  ORF type:complete len:209 (-),score=27.03 gnl/TRDRNA2_/TRDRNA2_197664_c0_seq1:304-930(-)
MRTVFAAILLPCVVQAQMTPLLRKPSVAAAPFVPPVNSGRKLPLQANWGVEPHTSGSSQTPRLVPLKSFNLADQFDKAFTPPPESFGAGWHKISEENGKCYEADVNVAPFTLEFFLLKWGKFEKGACASVGYGSASGTETIDVPSFGSMEVNVFARGGAALIQSRFPHTMASIFGATLVSFCVGAGITFAVLRLRRKTAVSEEPLLIE